MTDRERFQATFSHLHASDGDWEELTRKMKQTPRHPAYLSRRAFALALAAALLLALGVTAYAVGRGFLERQQASLREEYQVDEHHIASYVEPPLPEEPQPGVTLLSVYHSGSGLKVLFTVSPVAEEDVRGMFQQDLAADGRTHYLLYLVSTGEHDGLLTHFYTPGDWEYLPGEQSPWVDDNGNELLTVTEEGKRRRYLAQAYDPETRSLTLSCGILGTLLPEGAAEVEMHVCSYDFWAYPDGDNNLTVDQQHSIHQDFGTVTVPIPAPDTRSLRFTPPIGFENPDYSGTGSLLGAEISAVGIQWLVRVDDPAAGYTCDSQPVSLDQAAYRRQFSWTNRMERLLSDAALEFADGTLLPCSGFPSYSVDDTLLLHLSGGGWSGTIDLTQLAALHVAGQRFPLE